MIYVYFVKVFFKKNLFTWLSLFKLNNLKVTHNLYSQCLTQTSSKTVGVPTRGPGSQLVNAACFLVPDDDARGNHSNARFILVPAEGPYVQQRECARALYYLAPGVLVVEDTSEAREGGKPPSLC